MSDETTSSARIYWVTWGSLLVLTLIMLILDGTALSRSALLVFMLGAMAIKAGLITGNFMHLRHERLGIVLTVIVGLFVMALIFYGLIVPDALRIREMMDGQQ